MNWQFRFSGVVRHRPLTLLYPGRLSSHRAEACAAVRSSQGQALVEMSLVLPLLLLLMLNMINFSFYIYDWITVNDATRAAAEYQVYNGNAISGGGSPTYANVKSVVTNDAVSLPGGNSTICVVIQSTLNGAATLDPSSPASCFGLTPTTHADPETTYRAWFVDVYYPFVPLVSGLSLISSQTIHQQAVMRSMQ